MDDPRIRSQLRQFEAALGRVLPIMRAGKRSCRGGCIEEDSCTNIDMTLEWVVGIIDDTMANGTKGSKSQLLRHLMLPMNINQLSTLGLPSCLEVQIA